MNRLLPTSLQREDEHGDTAYIAYAVISYDPRVALYSLFKSQGVDKNTLTTTIQTFPFKLTATRALNEYVESKINEGFFLCDQSTGHSSDLTPGNVLADFPYLSSNNMENTLDPKLNYWVKPLPSGIRCSIEIDIFKNLCQLTTGAGSIISIDKSLEDKFKSMLDGFYHEAVLLEAIFKNGVVHVVDVITINGRKTEMPIEARNAWLNKFIVTDNCVSLVQMVKINSNEDLYSAFNKIPESDTAILLKGDSQYLSGKADKTIQYGWKISRKLVVPLVVSKINKNMLVLAFMSGNQPVPLIMLPKNGFDVNHLDIVNVSVDITEDQLSFTEILGVSDDIVGMEYCENPYELVGLKSPIPYQKSMPVDFDTSAGFDHSFK